MSATATNSSETRPWLLPLLAVVALGTAAAIWFAARRPPPAPVVLSPAGQPSVTGRVTVAAALKDRIGPDDTVFVFARPTEGSRMPVALLKKHGRDLPLDFALDDTLAMTPEARLSKHARVIVGVRVSRRGDVIPVAGDLEGELAPVALGSTGLVLEISRERK